MTKSLARFHNTHNGGVNLNRKKMEISMEQYNSCFSGKGRGGGVGGGDTCS